MHGVITSWWPHSLIVRKYKQQFVALVPGEVTDLAEVYIVNVYNLQRFIYSNVVELEVVR